MFTGDNVLGTGTPVFRDLPLYLHSLRRMSSCNPGALYTSHGPLVTQGKALIEQYITHRQERVDQVLAVLRAHHTPVSAEQITRQIYSEIPEHLMQAAAGNTLQALRVLQQGGQACLEGASDGLQDVRALSGAVWQSKL
eukprot:TRINITY_DN3033_c0_g1_i7.p1 TRINITY_DN3033_c0_g1~~TRINITY_DN3033_c0_g1_i7.p1  ORF type:complete len:139 (-),score=42.83 TRINITY_DN3033_c0_g1_i7:371-787(-)